jgi:eukaryotic-like serine/threonine-protein kinase
MPEDPVSSPSSEQPTLDRAAHHSAGSFGRYKLLQRLGEGGMGEVWLAEQTEPVRRQVALKVIKAGMDSAQVVARFEAERQALALMDHPAIATVFDGGTTPQGRPYFAMEYVKGEPITVYCDRQRLSTHQRLELFMQVCEGVQHAHQKGIIHRDLKPSNVLVTIQDDRPVPKIIDFGVAKAMSQQLTDRSLFTELGVLIGTPEYMSPEQAEMSGLDIDTRTDVYALGVLLYELLTGTLPFERGELRQAGLMEIQRIIREKEPPRPSTRVIRGPASAEAARNRQTEPRRLLGELRGDLDWITMRALEKDRTRRYQTANALAMDVRRHLNDEPVAAGPPSASYRAIKFMRRHRVGVAAAATLALVLAIFAGAMALQARRIARERDRANREARTAKYVSEFLVSVFKVSSPSDRVAGSVTAREILDTASERMEREVGEPETKATLLTTMAGVYLSLGLFPKALALNEQALALRRQLWGPVHPDVAASLSAVAASSGDRADRERLLRQALEMQRQLSGVKPDDLAFTLLNLANALEESESGEALALAEEALKTSQSAHPEPHELLLRAWKAVGAARFRMAKYKDAEEALRFALDMALAVYGPRHFETLGTRMNIASVQMLQGRYAAAEASYREILLLETPLVAPTHPQRIIWLGNLGAALFFQKKYAEAEPYYREALDIARKVYGNGHLEVAQSLANVGQALDAQGKSKDAIAILSESVSVARKAVGNDSPSLAMSLTYLSDALRHAGNPREAEQAAREALTVDVKELGREHPATRHAEGALGRALAKQRRWDEAEPLLLTYATALGSEPGVEGDLGEVTHETAEMYAAWGKPEKAKQWRAKLEAQQSPDPRRAETTKPPEPRP